MTKHRIKHFKLLSCRGTHNPTHFMRLGRGPNGPGGNLKVLGYGRWTFNHKITNYAMRPSRPSLSLSTHVYAFGMPYACLLTFCFYEGQRLVYNKIANEANLCVRIDNEVSEVSEVSFTKAATLRRCDISTTHLSK